MNETTCPICLDKDIRPAKINLFCSEAHIRKWIDEHDD